jgi:hypothetical protein
VIRRSYAALRNLVTSLLNVNPDPDPNPMLSGQVESESEKTGSDPHHWFLHHAIFNPSWAAIPKCDIISVFA